jgi:quercetin dioxygenase-like cupin family protein
MSQQEFDGNKSRIRTVDEGEWHSARLGENFCIRVPATTTSGMYSVVEFNLSPGDSGPLHYHEKEDQCVLVLEGTVRIVLAEKTINAIPGQSLAMMRGIPHGLGNATQEPVRYLSISVPGGAEEALVIVANNPNMDHAGLLELATRFDVTLVGPPILG